MKFDAIVFDFDGVIADSEMIANAALADALTALGSATTTEEALARYSGRRWSDCFPLIKEQLGRPVPQDFLDGLIGDAVERLSAEIEAVRGADRFIESQGHRPRAIASSSSLDWLGRCLERFELAHHFGDHVYSAEQIDRGKPHPDIYLSVADALAVAPEAALVIEDSPTGVEAGSRAGMTVVGFLAGSHIRDGHEAKLRDAGATHIVHNYAELTVLLTDLEG